MDINLKKLKPDIRHLNDMREVVYDKEWLKTAPNLELYYMYRGLKEKNGLRYNITVVPTRMLGKELVKTKGHVHIGSFGETYTVLEGEAIYLMQKTKDNIVEDIYAVKAQKGESVIIPPLYGHVTINPSNQDLKIGDWSSQNCKSDYSLFEKLNGACYYYTKKGWIKNENYKNVPQIRFEKPMVGELDIKSILETTK
ncbi:glucose-6-phosphate isomerase [Patescibacteria group bacterium]|nr:glucose-6-phosphate isomerase [Patescibacteria group bacterium]MBU4367483.1 glucose-6-phosphate isomerase [Patescibacteria group bacterium]MBU4462089.1 glucose-6-phosphate isomerase [Patescibacteria group bacterium]MCG2700475.1 glucose-6-phosphate isomerase [Candidatus Parcubacteria bacterium]